MSELETADALAAMARDDGPPPLAPELAFLMIEDAVDAALETPEAPTRVTRARAIWPWAASAAAALALAAGGWWATREPASPPSAVALDTTSRFELPSGDAVAVTAGARFSIERLDERRRLRVTEGTALFDVTPLGPGESFEVVTPHLVARVVGTVFTVESSPEGSVVRVYEGRVVVEHEGQRETVRAGASLAVGASDGGSADPLRTVAREAARRREDGRGSGAERAHEPPTAIATTDALGADHGDEQAVVEPAPSTGPGVTRADGSPTPDRAVGTDPSVTDARAPTPERADSTRAAPIDARAPAPERADPTGPTADDARTWIADGQPARALALARERVGAGWRVVEGDALRATGEFADAVSAYERAAADPAYRVRAGYLVATTRAEHLGDASGALQAIARYGCDAAGSPLAERALGLRARLLTRGGRDAEAREVAADYLVRFPRGPHRAAMDALR